MGTKQTKKTQNDAKKQKKYKKDTKWAQKDTKLTEKSCTCFDISAREILLEVKKNK